MSYILAAIAGIWMADGLALLVAPRVIMARVREVVSLSPNMLRLEVVAVSLGIILVIGGAGLHYEPLWTIAGLTMVAKGLFVSLGPEPWRQRVLQWCLQREDVDYRFWGMALCTLAILLLHAIGWLGHA